MTPLNALGKPNCCICTSLLEREASQGASLPSERVMKDNFYKWTRDEVPESFTTHRWVLKGWASSSLIYLSGALRTVLSFQCFWGNWIQFDQQWIMKRGEGEIREELHTEDNFNLGWGKKVDFLILIWFLGIIYIFNEKSTFTKAQNLFLATSLTEQWNIKVCELHVC